MEINPKFNDITQNSEDWDSIRLGKFTASMFSDVMMDKKTKGYQNTITKVAFERLIGKSQIQFSSQWMDYGHQTEPEADENYCIETFNETENGGIWTINDWVAASPDAKIVGLNAGCEYKCPSFSTYREYLEGNEKKGEVVLPASYFWQVHGQMLCTGWDFIHYMPYLSPNIKQLLTTVKRDQSILDQLTARLEEAIIDAQNLINKYKK